MLEQSLGFLRSGLQGRLTREKYVDPKYQKQIAEWEEKQNIAKGKRIVGAMAEVERGHLLKGLAQSLGVAQNIREEIKAGDTSAFPYLLGLAILIDIVDPIPILGLIVKLVAKPIVIYGTLFRGRLKYKYASKLIYWFWGITVMELIPGINWLPLETVSVLMLWRATVKMRIEKEVEEEENNNKIISLTQLLKKRRRSEQQQLQQEEKLARAA